VTLAGDLRSRAEQIRPLAAEAREPLIDLLLGLSQVDAPSGDREALQHAANAFAAELDATGAPVSRHCVDGIPHLEARIGPPGDRHVLVLCHYDTVWPAGAAAKRPAYVDGGRIHGPGTFDMRGGIAAVLGALRLLGPEALPRPVRLLFTGDEETGSASSSELITALAGKASLVLVPEPPLPGGGLKTSRKGWSAYRIDAQGREAHAGLEPDRGVNAIDVLVDALLAARSLQDPERGTTVNVGTISGGSRVNVVAGEAHAELEVRATTVAEQERVHSALAALHTTRQGAALTVAPLHVRPPMERTPALAAAAQRTRALARLIGLALDEGPAGGTSDSNLIAHLGVPVVDGLGPEGGGAHALDEHVMIDSLVQRAALIALLLADDSSDQL
jgi:glutamate carboxypeptidase